MVAKILHYLTEASHENEESSWFLDLFFIFKYIRKATDMFLPISWSILLKIFLLWKKKEEKMQKRKKVWLGLLGFFM